MLVSNSPNEYEKWNMIFNKERERSVAVEEKEVAQDRKNKSTPPLFMRASAAQRRVHPSCMHSVHDASTNDGQTNFAACLLCVPGRATAMIAPPTSLMGERRLLFSLV